MTIGESPPRLFDRRLRRQRAARSGAAFAKHDFLHDFAAGLVAERLGDVSRNFARGCIWGDRGRQILNRLSPGKIGAVVHADSYSTSQLAVVADAEQSPFADGVFDLVVSLLDLHAVNDPIGALIQIRKSLVPDGLFIGVMFGAETLNELRSALGDAEIEGDGGLSPRVFPFADVRDAGSLLQRAGLALPVADVDRLMVKYAHPLKLLLDLRGSGETNILNGRRRQFLKKSLLTRALNRYVTNSGSEDGFCKATFSFVTLTGWSPHHSQQSPLKPGSAQTRLADVFRSPAID
jgi:SAM-dependent methyltransferase